jgi:transcription antitermination factor NusG
VTGDQPAIFGAGKTEMNCCKTVSLRPNYLPWYVVRTRSNQEKIAATALASKGFEEYLPCYKAQRRWSDRVVETSLPLFPGYVFCRFDASLRSPIITTPGVVSLVAFGKDPAPIPDSEIEAIKDVLRSDPTAEPCPFLKEGQRVRIKYGLLQGLEGILLKEKSKWRIVVSITMLQRSVSAEVDRDWVVAV